MLKAKTKQELESRRKIVIECALHVLKLRYKINFFFISQISSYICGCFNLQSSQV